MAHGVKPYGRTQQQETIFGVQDMGELAARLGSVVTFDRRGNIIWLDDFESGIEKWQHTSVAGGESLEWVATYARNGGFCAKLNTDNHADDDAYMSHNMPYPAATKSGIECSFKHDTYLRQIFIGLTIETGLTLLVAAVRWTQATNTWAYYNTAAGYTDLTPVKALRRETTLFHTAKLVVDFAIKEYIRLIVNDTLFDLSGLGMYEPGAAVTATLVPWIRIITNADDVTSLYVDDVIITQNEP